jgi:hypothetical protein
VPKLLASQTQIKKTAVPKLEQERLIDLSQQALFDHLKTTWQAAYR